MERVEEGGDGVVLFVKDIVAWGLHQEGSRVMEVHLLKDRSLMCGPWIEKRKWEAGQRRMREPYPRSLKKPVDVLVMEAK
jgi:hypothetical protein